MHESQPDASSDATGSFLGRIRQSIFEGASTASAPLRDSGHWEAGKYEPVGLSGWVVRHNAEAEPIFDINVFREGLGAD